MNGYYVDEIVDMMINGDAALALNWSGAAMDIYWQEVENIQYAVPKEGSNIWFDCMVIRQRASIKRKLKCLSTSCSIRRMLIGTEYVGYATPNKAALEMVKESSPEVVGMDAYNPSAEVVDRCEVFIDLGETKAVYNKAWMEIKAN